MAVWVEWDNPEKTIIRYDLSGHWTWDEFYPAFAQAKEMLASVSWTVYFIVNPIDTISRSYMPPGVMTHVGMLYRQSTGNTGGSVMVGGSIFFRTLYKVGSTLYPATAKRFAFADTLEDARAYLAQKMLESA